MVDAESRIVALGDNKGQWLNRFMSIVGLTSTPQDRSWT